jgi:23S rRNA (uracil1939-C5)-methyltransferase
MQKKNKNPDLIPPRVLDLVIDSMAFGGKGVARHDGKVYFVEDGIEGDTATVEVTEETDRYSEARVISLKAPSAHRGPSPCLVSDMCGGCQWQGVPYEQQMTWKKQFVVNALRRIGKLGESIEVETVPSPKVNGYRNRIFVRARIKPDGRLTVGYFRRGSRDFVEISRCQIAVDRLNDFITHLETVSFKEDLKSRKINTEIKFKFEMQDIPARPTTEPHLLLSVYDPDDSAFPVDVIIRTLAAVPGVAWAGGARDLPEAPFVEFEKDLDVSFHTAAGLFQQVNIPHNHTVRRLVKEAVDDFKPQRILDLFCGSGNLSLPLANGIRVVDGIEFSKRSIMAANHNVATGKIPNTNYVAGDTEKFLWRAAKSSERYDMVIADPPRAGMFKSLIPLVKLKPRHIIYVSCDPTTLSRDLSALVKFGFEIKRFVALDFFPNTYHIESFVILEKTSNHE